MTTADLIDNLWGVLVGMTGVRSVTEGNDHLTVTSDSGDVFIVKVLQPE